MHTPCHTKGHIAFLVSAPDPADSEDELPQDHEVRLDATGARLQLENNAFTDGEWRNYFFCFDCCVCLLMITYYNLL